MTRTFPFETREARPGIVRPARPRDARPALVIVREATGDRPRTISTVEQELWSPGEWRRNRIPWSPHGVTLAAEVEGKLAGILGCTRGRSIPFRHVSQFGITVGRRYRGMGVGRALLQAVEMWAAAHGVTRIELGVFPHNEPARRLYASLGYQEEGLQRGAVRFPEGEVDLLLMAKIL